MHTLLDSVRTPGDLRKLSVIQLTQLAAELRDFVLHTTQTKAGHIKSSLGVTELTLALHYVYNTPDDILIWDVGHQAYIHKILTGRKDKFHSNRKKGGLSGFTKRSESEYDPFGAGHSSTSISAAIGFAEADRLQGKKRHYIAVIGDGALTGGESLEALNYLGERQLNVTVILNDNQSSIDANVGALAHFGNYKALCDAFHLDFEGGVDGHSVEKIINSLSRSKEVNRPKMIHLVTQKGKGWKAGSGSAKATNSLSFQDVFSQTLIRLAETNDTIVGVSPAMLSGSGLHEFGARFPERVFDVGIAEQHAVTMSAGMAANGLKPFCHLYSTFAQRGYDQIIHDVALQKLPVVFCLDRAGLAGEDGPTHHGAFDPGFLNTIPGIVVAASLDGSALAALMEEAAGYSGGPFAIRYPKDGSFGKLEKKELPLGKLQKVKNGSAKAVISFGAIGLEVQKALEGSEYAHFDLVYLKPLDEAGLIAILEEYNEVIIVEENSKAGGAGESIVSLAGRIGVDCRIKCKCLPDAFIEHGSRQQLLEVTGLDASSLKEFIDR